MSIMTAHLCIINPQKLPHHVIGLGGGNIERRRPMTRSKFQVPGTPTQPVLAVRPKIFIKPPAPLFKLQKGMNNK